MVGFPPDTTRRLQALDVSFFGPLKTFYTQACDNSMVSHPGQAITDKDVGQFFGTPYLRAATVANAVKGFKACGIEPYNPQIFAAEDFAPSATTERDLQEESSHDQPTIASSGQQTAAVENDLPLQQIIMQPGTAHQQDRPEVVPDEAENLTCISESNDNGNGNVPKPTTSRGQVSLNSIKPFPVVNMPRATKRKIPDVSAAFLTSTPVKDFLLVKEHDKEERNVKIAAKILSQKSTKPQENAQPI
ncbi:hypothetical protein PR048_008256 [Dryococelus australis]|uniref:Uncharacterized protein n=1 Tax=Dryococelus australis TaxID=614101 RepID=A0ABQ9HWL4_9NEOP|nr:hypothetical protein PR048_008256 [Dryococelus australis]